MNPLVKDGMDLVRDLERARKDQLEKEREFNTSKSRRADAEAAFIKWLVPEDAKIGDRYCVPVQETFLDVRVLKKESWPVGGETGAEPHVTKQYSIEWRNIHGPRKGL